jgi:hypothetical protein
MRVLCRHGHFAFYPRRSIDLARFATQFDAQLMRVDDYYTFPELKDAPEFSIQGKDYLGVPAVKTYAGKPWEVMRENGFVFHLATLQIVPKSAVLLIINLPQNGYYFLAETALIQPGSRNLSTHQILSYDAEFLQDSFRLKVGSYAYE